MRENIVAFREQKGDRPTLSYLSGGGLGLSLAWTLTKYRPHSPSLSI